LLPWLQVTGRASYQIFHLVDTILTILATTRQTQKPTLKWAFMLMREVAELKVEVDSKMETQIIDLDVIKEKNTIDNK